MDEVGDPREIRVTCAANGETRVRVNTRDQIQKLPDIIEHFSRRIPLKPGDMFATGAPGGAAVDKPNAGELPGAQRAGRAPWRLDREWRARRESNPRPSASETDTLSN